jgi:DNA-binding NarL/FixJ family response regulator
VEQSARHGDTAAVGVLREAGDASAQRAPASAARWYGAALDLMPAGAPAEERIGLLTSLAGANAAIGAFEDSRAALLESIDAAPGDDHDLRVSLIGACAGVEQLLGHHREAHNRLTAALDTLPAASSANTVELFLHMATGAFYRQDYDEMRESADRALVAARQVGDASLVAATTSALTVAWAFAGDVPKAEACRAEAAELVDGMSDEVLAGRLDAVANLCAAELYLDRYPEGEAHSRRGLTVAHATGQAEVAPFLIPVLGSVLQLTGRLEEAVQVLDEAVEAARLSGNVQALAWNLLNGANASLGIGEVETGVALAQESVDITRHLDNSLVSTYSGANFSFVLYEAGQPQRAIDMLTSHAGGDELPLIPGGWKANYFELLTKARLALGDLEGAERDAARAAAVAKRVGLHLPPTMAHRAAAAVALYRGDGATAASEGLASAAEAEQIGARVEAALARTLAGRGFAAAGETDRAIAELERAAREFDACGAVRYRSQAELELRKLGRHIHRRTAPGRAQAAGVEALTEREGEIARLVVDRRTNPEIAGELFLSVKTVETHMRNIFRKLDVTSRVDVARTLESANAGR